MRGPPGTHDLQILNGILDDFLNGKQIKIVRFDKKQCNGEGDRREGVEKYQDLDILILEGWCVNLKPLENFNYEQYEKMYEGMECDFKKELSEYSNQQLGYYQEIFKKIGYSVMLDANCYLDSVRWRDQAEKVQQQGGLNSLQIRKFVMYFQVALNPQLYVPNSRNHFDLICNFDSSQQLISITPSLLS